MIGSLQSSHPMCTTIHPWLEFPRLESKHLTHVTGPYHPSSKHLNFPYCKSFIYIHARNQVPWFIACSKQHPKTHVSCGLYYILHAIRIPSVYRTIIFSSPNGGHSAKIKYSRLLLLSLAVRIFPGATRPIWYRSISY